MSSRGIEAVELARSAGLVLDDWQVFVLDQALGVREDGGWAAFEIGLNIPRQNGKGSILEALELFWLFELGERTVIHSAHEFPTSLEAFLRLEMLIEGSQELYSRVKRITRSHGEEGISLTTGERIRFRTRTKGGGRGFTAAKVVFDEAMILPEKAIAALLPTLSAQKDAQVVYAGSAVDQMALDEGVAFARVRERGHAGDDPRLAYFEWSVEVPPRDDGKPVTPSDVTDEIAADPEAWAQANPALGIRISSDHIEAERRAMGDRTFAVERLGVGDWPETEAGGSSLIDLNGWDDLADADSQIAGALVFAFDVTPDQSWATIAVAGRREDGLAHIEVVDHRRGTSWIVERLAELRDKHGPAGIYCDASGVTGSLIPKLEKAGVMVETMSAVDHAKACASFVEAVSPEDGAPDVRHLGQRMLRNAIKGAAARPLGDAWAWSRKSSSVDISPLVAGTLAFWGATTGPTGDYVLDVAAMVG